MSLYIDVKYLNLTSSNLPNFKKKGESLWNFRCPFCGDSEKKKSKARGYIYKKGNDLYYRCHNCTFGTTFSKFIEKIDPRLHKEYIKERFLNGETGKHNYKKPVLFFPPKFKNKVKINLQSIEDLEEEHWARRYVYERAIPDNYHSNLYFAPDFKKFVQETGSPKYAELKEEDPRLVIPFYDEEGNLFAFQGRALKDSKVRYISVKLNTDAPLIYGLDRVNKEALVYVVEGPIDSMFVKNSVAAAGSDLSRVLKEIPNPVFVFDNEPRNKEVCKTMAKLLSSGKRFVIWPDSLREKDINDMILAGKDPEKIIKENTYEGLEAGARFAFWRKS
jgi:hypothetical protein